MWTKQEQEMLLEEVNGRWMVALHNAAFTLDQENEERVKQLSNLRDILDSEDDLSFHYKNPSDYSLLINIVQDFEPSCIKERILAKIERERDGKNFTKQAIEYLQEKFEEIKRIDEEEGFMYFGLSAEAITIYTYLKDNFEDKDEREMFHAVRSGDYSAEKLLEDEVELLKLYKEVK